MRLCRYGSETTPQVGFYGEAGIIPLAVAAAAFTQSGGSGLSLPPSATLLDFLPPDGPGFASAKRLAGWLDTHAAKLPAGAALDPAKVQLLVPVPRPNKIFLLAGNYADHIREGGGVAEERQNTFPYVFMKPPSTTLTHPGKPVKIPAASPAAIDWELELAVVIGRRVKGVSEADALTAVAGYTIVNDVSNRRYKPNPARKPRDRDAFFDWLHGKWFDGFCPMSGVVATPDAVPDPQALRMKLDVNGVVKQEASTGQMIFPVAAIIEFISRMVTLEPGDIISTGTPAGVGATKGDFLKPGDVMTGWIENIGTLVTPVEAE